MAVYYLERGDFIMDLFDFLSLVHCQDVVVYSLYSSFSCTFYKDSEFLQCAFNDFPCDFGLLLRYRIIRIWSLKDTICVFVDDYDLLKKERNLYE